MNSFEDVLSRNNGIGPGFDFIRVFLAISIVLFHSFTVTNQYYPLDETSPMWLLHYALVPMFFALSGFLVTASAGRLTLKKFLLHRGLRIVPALAVDTIVCALCIGPLFTTISLADYFSSSDFFAYFLNIFGWVHYDLPGVFKELPVTRVNGSLWTVPFELMCYALMSLIIAFKLVKTKYPIILLILSYLLIAVAVKYYSIPDLIDIPLLKKALLVSFIEYESQAVTAFLFGVAAFQFRKSIPYSIYAFAFCTIICLTIGFAFSNEEGQQPYMRFILMPIITYITLFLGLTYLRLPSYFRGGDYSYGIYLYHQPFLQIAIIIIPTYVITPHFGATLCFVTAIPFILATAWFSWHFVEKPALALRRIFSSRTPLLKSEVGPQYLSDDKPSLLVNPKYPCGPSASLSGR